MPLTILTIWFLRGLAAPFVAASKGRSFVGWLILGLIFRPLALLGVAIAGLDQVQATIRHERAGLQSGKMRKCPSCAEVVMTEASKCRFCSEVLPPLPQRNWFGREIR